MREQIWKAIGMNCIFNFESFFWGITCKGCQLIFAVREPVLGYTAIFWFAARCFRGTFADYTSLSFAFFLTVRCICFPLVVLSLRLCSRYSRCLSMFNVQTDTKIEEEGEDDGFGKQRYHLSGILFGFYFIMPIKYMKHHEFS